MHILSIIRGRDVPNSDFCRIQIFCRIHFAESEYSAEHSALPNNEENMLIEAWNGSIYRWHGVSLWWKCLSTPFIYTLFYIIYTNYTFGYFTHTVYTHSIPCVLFIICVLCVFYDSIHVLNVMFFSEPYLVLFIIMVSKQVYKELWWSRIFQLKINESRGPGERVSGECGGNHTTDWLRAICR